MRINYAERLLAALTRERPADPAIHWRDQWISRGELGALGYRLARVFHRHGLTKAGTMTILGSNRPDVLAARYAGNLLGAKAVTLDLEYQPNEQRRLVAAVDTDLLVVAPEFAEAATRVSWPNDLRVVGLGTCGMGADALLEAADLPGLSCGAAPVAATDVAMILPTGGTTGPPKGVVRTFGATGRSVPAEYRPEFRGRLLVVTPIGHLVGFQVDKTLLCGGRVVLHERFDAGAVLAAIAEHRVTKTWLLPAFLYRLLDHPDLATTDLSSLRRLMYGGSAAVATRLREARRVFGDVLLQGYGQAEAGTISVLWPEEHAQTDPDRLDTVGRPVPGTAVSIQDDAGRDLPPGECGEVCVRSPDQMAGYWNQPELTAEVLRAGWLRTGDVGFLDAHGYLHLVDRLRDRIFVVTDDDAYVVHTAELEGVLTAHPGVAEAAVYGVPGPDALERPHANVVLRPGSSVDAGQLREHVSRHTGRSRLPEVIEFVDALPLTGIGKVDKRRLRARHGHGFAPPDEKEQETM